MQQQKQVWYIFDESIKIENGKILNNTQSTCISHVALYYLNNNRPSTDLSVAAVAFAVAAINDPHRYDEDEHN